MVQFEKDKEWIDINYYRVYNTPQYRYGLPWSWQIGGSQKRLQAIYEGVSCYLEAEYMSIEDCNILT